jgi:hypothetical protein
MSYKSIFNTNNKYAFKGKKYYKLYMENNIFLKQKKDKHNPDIMNKYNTVDTERAQTEFNLSNTIYNPITGIIPNKINDSKDLVLQKDNTLNKNDIMNMIKTKEAERILQDTEYKPLKTKVLNIASQTPQNVQQNVQNNYIETFEDMKRGVVKPKSVDKNYNNILDGLKDLGIIKL